MTGSDPDGRNRRPRCGTGASQCRNSGQTCLCANRLLVQAGGLRDLCGQIGRGGIEAASRRCLTRHGGPGTADRCPRTRQGRAACRRRAFQGRARRPGAPIVTGPAAPFSRPLCWRMSLPTCRLPARRLSGRWRLCFDSRSSRKPFTVRRMNLKWRHEISKAPPWIGQTTSRPPGEATGTPIRSYSATTCAPSNRKIAANSRLASTTMALARDP